MLRDAGRAEWAAAWAFPPASPRDCDLTLPCCRALCAPFQHVPGPCPLPPPEAPPCRAARCGVPPAVPRGAPVARPAPGSPMHTFSSSSSAEPLR